MDIRLVLHSEFPLGSKGHNSAFCVMFSVIVNIDEKALEILKELKGVDENCIAKLFGIGNGIILFH